MLSILICLNLKRVPLTHSLWSDELIGYFLTVLKIYINPKKMKNLPPLFSTVLLLSFILMPVFSLLAQQPQVEKLSEDQVQQGNIELAQRLAEDILQSMAEGSYYEFQEGEAIPMLEQQFNENMQKQQYQMLKSQLGEYQSNLDYQEAYKATQAGQKFTLYRFKGQFAQSEPEVRVVLTTENQLAGLNIVPWQDQLQ